MVQALINIDVPEIKIAEIFYCSAFGLSVSRRFGADFVELQGLGIPCYLLEKKPGSSVSSFSNQIRSYERHWTPVHLDIVVEDIKRSLQKALAAGAIAETDVKVTAYGRIVMLSDPFGHGICLLEFNTEGYAAIATSS